MLQLLFRRYFGGAGKALPITGQLCCQTRGCVNIGRRSFTIRHMGGVETARGRAFIRTVMTRELTLFTTGHFIIPGGVASAWTLAPGASRQEVAVVAGEKDKCRPTSHAQDRHGVESVGLPTLERVGYMVYRFRCALTTI